MTPGMPNNEKQTNEKQRMRFSPSDNRTQPKLKALFRLIARNGLCGSKRGGAGGGDLHQLRAHQETSANRCRDAGVERP